MSFDLVPADVLLKIFHQLPFKDRVRLGGVNRLFKEISEKSISTMRSLEINDDLVAYSISTLAFSSLLESCSSTLESIDASNINSSNPSCNKWLLNQMGQFVYPKLEQLKIMVNRFDNGQVKSLISRSRNLRSIILYLSRDFEWPENIVFEKMEKLVVKTTSIGRHNVNLSPTLHPLIGMVPNLKHLTIQGGVNFSVQEFSQLLVSIPSLEELNLELPCSTNICPVFKAAIPTWYLPTLYVNMDCHCQILSSVFHHFPASFPRMESFTLRMFTEIDDQDITALSQLKYLKKLRLPDLEMTKDEFTRMMTGLPSIVVLEISQIDDQEVLQSLSQLEHLREFCLTDMGMTEDEIIDVINNVPSISVLGISKILDVSSPLEFIHFLMSTAAIFQRNLEIQLVSMYVYAKQSEMGHLNAIMKEMEKNVGPVVEMDVERVLSIRYKSLDG